MTESWFLFCQKNSREARLNSDAADTPKGLASRRLPLQGNRKRKGAPLIKTMRLFRKKKLGLGELRLSDMNKNSPKYSKLPEMIT